jgi:hypothetical protein
MLTFNFYKKMVMVSNIRTVNYNIVVVLSSKTSSLTHHVLYPLFLLPFPLFSFSLCLEPPQGQLKQVTSNQQSNVTYLKIRSGRWQLSEDPEDRKDGLWIWGLFEEPLYPFLLLQIETEEYVIPGSDSSGSGKDADVIEPLTLYAQVNHRRDKKTGQVELDSAPLNLREFESVKGKYNSWCVVYMCMCECIYVYVYM